MSEERHEAGEVLTPEEVRTVEFYGDEIAAALIHAEGEALIYVPLRPLCEYLGLSWSAQFERIKRDEVLSEAIKTVRVTRTDEIVRVTRTVSRRGDPNVLCLPLKFLPGWLFGIETSRIKKPELRERIILYRRECYDKLWDAFKYDVMQSIGALPPPAPLATGAQIAYELATAVQNLAREQIELESRMTRAAQWAKGIESRVTALELRLQPGQQISEAQAAELAQQVKAVAHALASKGGANGYQRVYGELYRRYSIGTYRALPQEKFSEALDWLRAWYEEIAPTGEAAE
jgi:hypothetical protein